MTMHKHDFSLSHLPKSYLVDHLRVPHEQTFPRGSTLQSAETVATLRKWSIDDLRNAHARYHEGRP